MSKGGGGGTSTVTQEIDPDVKRAYLGNLDYSRDVANTMGTRQFAGFDPSYQMGESMATQAATGGLGTQNINTAADLTRASAAYAPQQVGGFSGGPAALAGSTGYNAAQFGGASAGPAALAGASGYNAAQFGGASAGPAAQAAAAQANMANIGQYMNPYTSEVIDASMADLEKARQRASQQIGQQATAAKAFGGSRQGIAEALSNSEFGDTAGRTIAQLRAQGFDTAANLMQQDVARQQQAGLSNQAALNQMSQFNAGNLQQAGLSNQAALNQAGQFGAGAANQAALANQAARNQMAQFNAGNLQQAGMGNQAAMNQAAQFGAGAANQAVLSNQAAMNQMNQYNAGLGQQAQQLNQAAGLQGAQFRLGAAQQLGAQGAAQQANQFANAQAMMGLGQQRQSLAQQQMDAARNLGLERLGIMQGALGLQPANLGGTSSQPYYQNTGANVLGGALGGASLAGMIPGLSAGMGAGAGALLGLI
jgi:hypothetical protein